MTRFARSRVALALSFVIALCVATLASRAAVAAPFRVLIGNDDGVGAEGIAALVSALTRDSSIIVDVYAPLENQSGTGDRYTTGPLPVMSSMTADGYPAFAVDGFPADGILFGLLQGLPPARPDLVVSGINEGQNIGELINISGTVGAALTAARLGIPAIAVSQGLGPNIDYEEAARFTAQLVSRFRVNATFRRLFRISPTRARVLNLNFPTCTTGELRGVRVVPVGRGRQVVGYEQEGSSDVWNPILLERPYGSNDCDSRLRRPVDDLDAMNNGFASATPLDPDLTSDEVLTQFVRFVER